MNDEDLRLECLRLADSKGGGRETVVKRAQAYLDFIHSYGRVSPGSGQPEAERTQPTH